MTNDNLFPVLYININISVSAPRPQNTDLTSLFQDKSNTASVCPSTGSAAAPWHQREQAAMC